MSPTRKAKARPPEDAPEAAATLPHSEFGGAASEDDPTPSHSTADAPAFEPAFAELQRIVERLEGGGLDLDRVVELFDRGAALAQTCERQIADAELRVTRLTAETASPLSDA